MGPNFSRYGHVRPLALWDIEQERGNIFQAIGCQICCFISKILHISCSISQNAKGLMFHFLFWNLVTFMFQTSILKNTHEQLSGMPKKIVVLLFCNLKNAFLYKMTILRSFYGRRRYFLTGFLQYTSLIYIFDQISKETDTSDLWRSEI